MKAVWSVLLLAALVSSLMPSNTRSSAVQAIITVTTPDDELNTDGDCSLREAIRAASSNQAVDSCTAGGDDDRIDIPAGTYLLSRSGTDNTGSSGDLDLVGRMTLQGAAASTTIIDANRTDRVFDVRPDANIIIRNLTLRHGAPRYDEYDQNDYGGDIRNYGVLILDQTVVTETSYPSVGGGIANFGTLTVSRSTIQQSFAIWAGGIFNTGVLTMTDSLVADNSSSYGGGIVNDGMATIVSSLLTGNDATGESEGSGAAIANSGTLIIRDSELRDNAADWGGAIFNDRGEALIINTRIADNSYQNGNGAGIYNNGIVNLENALVMGNVGGGGKGAGIANLGLLQVNNSTISFNGTFGTGPGSGPGTPQSGGGIFNIGTAYIANSTVSNNIAFNGGGISNGGAVFNLPPFGSEAVTNTGVLVLRNSTISENFSLESGAGIYNTQVTSSDARGNTVSLNNVTLANNVADFDDDGVGGAAAISSSYLDSIHVGNSVIANNTVFSGNTASDCAFEFVSRGYNLIESTNCRITGLTTGNLIGVDPMLGPLQNNGGPTATHALLPGSPAIDAGSPEQPGNSLLSCEAIDQRGVMRPQDGNQDGVERCDIGAYELQFTPLMSRRALMPMINR